MYKKKTSDLEKKLEHTHPSEISEYIKANPEDIMNGDRNFMEYMNEKFREKKIRKQDVFLKADIAQGYGYKLLTEEKVTRQRDVILRICYAADFFITGGAAGAEHISHEYTICQRSERCPSDDLF